MMPTPAPVFDAERIRTIDGDTLVVRLSKHHGDYSEKTVRLLGVDAPEVRGPDRERGLAAKAFTQAFLEGVLLQPYGLVVQTSGMDKYGRWLGYVWRKCDGASLNDALREAGHAHAVSVIAQMKREG